MISPISKGHHSSGMVLNKMKNKIPTRKMESLRSQSHQKRKMKKNLKVMPIFSKAPSIIKLAAGKEFMTKRSMILLTRMSSKFLFHQEDLSQTGTKISLLAIVFLAIILIIKQLILELMQEVIMWDIEIEILVKPQRMIMWEKKLEFLMGLLIETTINFLSYLITIMNVISEITMST